MNFRVHTLLLAPLCAFSMLTSSAHANVTILKNNDWTVQMGGFVELNVMTDSTRTYREIMGNSPVALSTSADGASGRTQFSLRDSRLAFTVDAPTYKNWATKGYFEMDFLGFDPQNTAAVSGSNPGNNSESAFFSNPTMRIRHAYMQTENDGWTVLAGQTWNLLGWQPYYFLGALQPSPLPGMLYQRNAQVRGMKTFQLSESKRLQTAVAIVRPPQADSELPSVEAGARLIMDGRMSGFTGGGAGSRQAQPMSFAVSGTARKIRTPRPGSPTGTNDDYTATGLALDTMIPILTSSDGKDIGNTLSFSAEFTTGTGFGDEFVGWTGNTSSPLNTSASASAKATNLDGGIGDYDASGSFHLIKVQTFNLQLQYHLPTDWAAWINVGYSQLYSSNIMDLATNGNSVSSGKPVYDRNQLFFANIGHDLTPQLRTGLEYDHVKTNYDGINQSAADDRFIATAYFIF